MHRGLKRHIRGAVATHEQATRPPTSTTQPSPSSTSARRKRALHSGHVLDMVAHFCRHSKQNWWRHGSGRVGRSRAAVQMAQSGSAGSDTAVAAAVAGPAPPCTSPGRQAIQQQAHMRSWCYAETGNWTHGVHCASGTLAGSQRLTLQVIL